MGYYHLAGTQSLWSKFVECRYCHFHFVSNNELKRHLENQCPVERELRMVMDRMTGKNNDYPYDGGE
jgi:hypothetical protein